MKHTAPYFTFALLLWLMLVASISAAADVPEEAVIVSFPKPGLSAQQLSVIVNDDDPDSVKIAAYYKEKRNIPDKNVIHVRFAPNRTVLPAAEFAKIKQRVDHAAGKHIQAYALTWAQPYRVDCMSITAAFTFGFDPAYCANGCNPTKPSPYYGPESTPLPYDTYKMRPSMSLAASNVSETMKLIDRGVGSDNSNPKGTGYLVSTTDTQRNVRSQGYPQTQFMLNKVFFTRVVKANLIHDKRDVMFYFTGQVQVQKIDSNTFLPGAVADHLTSAGGVLFDGGQMSILRWIDAGATGSYGTVVEPCNYVQKFPVPLLMMAHYLQGETLIESYWKSVQMPGQGIFIGEPLARPFGGYTSSFHDQELHLETSAIEPGIYTLQFSPVMVGPFHDVAQLNMGWGSKEITLNHAKPGYYRFELSKHAEYSH